MPLYLPKPDKTILEKEVVGILKDGRSEDELLYILKVENESSEEAVIKALANVCKNSSAVSSYCERVLVPEIKQLLETKCTVGEVLETMYKSHYNILVDEALCKALSGIYLVD